jgi:hypothetical protein
MNAVPPTADAIPGRSCPLSYRYSPAVFKRPADLETETLYVAGGLYGNVPALDAIDALMAAEPVAPTLVFNGDFNWFNTDDGSFENINHRVLAHRALRGNVETELAGGDGMAGCGCAYPASVSDEEVQRSNEILRALNATAARFPALRAQLGALPMHAAARVGALRIGIVHGDAESLAGWRFSHDQLDAPENIAWLQQAFGAANIDLFASSHTCLPVARQFDFQHQPRGVINNGAAGMPNFAGTHCGLVTRISTLVSPHTPLYGFAMRGIHVDAVAVHYDQARWAVMFLANWPPGSPGHDAYFRRIILGPRYALATAAARRDATVS